MSEFFNLARFPIFVSTTLLCCSQISAGWFSRSTSKLNVPASIRETTCVSNPSKTFRRSVRTVNMLVPGYHNYVDEKDIIEDCCEGLLKLDGAGKVLPGVADQWSVSEDGLRWTFFLRKNACYSDGQSVTAQDFLETLQRDFGNISQSEEIRLHLQSTFVTSLGIKNALRILEGASPISELGVKVLDPWTLELELEKPINPRFFLNTLAQPAVCIPVRTEYYQAIREPENCKTPLSYPSNGPFFISNYVHGERIELKKNPYYWNKDAVKISDVIYFMTKDPQQRAQKWLNGDLDYFLTGNPQEKAEINRYQQVRWNKIPGGGYSYFVYSLEGAFQKNRELRDLFALILDRDQLKQLCYFSSEESKYGVLSPYYGEFKRANPDWSHLNLDSRFQRASQFLQKKGYSADHPLQLRIITYIQGIEFERFQQYMSQMTQYVPECKIIVQHLESNDVIDRISRRKMESSYDLALVSKRACAPRPFSTFSAARESNGQKSCACPKVMAALPEKVSQLQSMAIKKAPNSQLKQFFKMIPNANALNNSEAQCFPWCQHYPEQDAFNKLFYMQAPEFKKMIYKNQDDLYRTFSQMHQEPCFLDEYDLLMQRIVADVNLTVEEEAELYHRLDQIVVYEWPVFPLCTAPLFFLEQKHLKALEPRRRDFSGRFPSEGVEIIDQD